MIIRRYHLRKDSNFHLIYDKKLRMKKVYLSVVQLIARWLLLAFQAVRLVIGKK